MFVTASQYSVKDMKSFWVCEQFHRYFFVSVWEVVKPKEVSSNRKIRFVHLSNPVEVNLQFVIMSIRGREYNDDSAAKLLRSVRQQVSLIFVIFEWVRRYINHYQSLVVVVCGFTCAVAVFVLNLRSHYLWVTFSIDHFRWTYLASELVNTLMIYFSLVTGSSLWNAFSRIGTRAQKRGSSIGKGKLWSP